jgi:hypothetical protein
MPNIVPIHIGAPNEKLEIVEALRIEIIHPSGFNTVERELCENTLCRNA